MPTKKNNNQVEIADNNTEIATNSKMDQKTIGKSTRNKGSKKEPMPTFEDAMTRIEEIVSLLENGETVLDLAMTLYEEGVSLLKYCTNTLDAAERKIQILQRGKDGGLTLQNFCEGNGEVKNDAPNQ